MLKRRHKGDHFAVGQVPRPEVGVTLLAALWTVAQGSLCGEDFQIGDVVDTDVFELKQSCRIQRIARAQVPHHQRGGDRTTASTRLLGDGVQDGDGLEGGRLDHSGQHTAYLADAFGATNGVIIVNNGHFGNVADGDAEGKLD